MPAIARNQLAASLVALEMECIEPDLFKSVTIRIIQYWAEIQQIRREGEEEEQEKIGKMKKDEKIKQPEREHPVFNSRQQNIPS